MTVYVVMGFLMLAVLRNIANEDRLLTASVVTLVTLASYWAYHFGPVEYLTHNIGYWAYLSLAPLASICLLWFVRNTTSTALMLLFVVLILIHLVSYLVESLGVYVDDIYQHISWVAFATEIIILMSERVSNAVFNLCHRVYHASHLDSNRLDHWFKDTLGAAK